jgi:RNA polymerase sigma-70 factor, ECF subfamily
MAAREEPFVLEATVPLGAAFDAPVPDPIAHLTAVYRDYPGLRALILRRVRDPEVAADILQDAAVTTLQKLREGQIARPENVGGFLYRVALNHLRNYRRKDRGASSSSEELDELAAPQKDAEWESAGHREWASIAESVLGELPHGRDRELLVRFYLKDEGKEAICAQLGLTHEHFNRVIFRARNRFRGLLEAKGFAKTDFLAIAALAVGLAAAGGLPQAPVAAGGAAQPTPAVVIANRSSP